jgi:hypothetical protein
MRIPRATALQAMYTKALLPDTKVEPKHAQFFTSIFGPSRDQGPLASRLLGLPLWDPMTKGQIRIAASKLIDHVSVNNGASPSLRLLKAMVGMFRTHKDLATLEHQRRVSFFCAQVAKKIGFSEEEIDKISTAAMFHDMGKLGWPIEFMNITGRLTVEEQRYKPLHLLIGVAILEGIGGMAEVAAIVGASHYYDAYPLDIKAQEIPLEAQVLSAVDFFDALVSGRAYRPGGNFKPERALGLLKARADSKQVKTPYDKNIISALEGIVLSRRSPLGSRFLRVHAPIKR